MFDAAELMSGGSDNKHDKVIIEYNVKQHNHEFRLLNINTGAITEMTLSNLLLDNGLLVNDICDTTIKQRDNSCWSIEFAIHSEADWHNIRTHKSVTFIDSRLWVSKNKIIKSTKWKHPYSEMPNGVFNARPGHCSNTMDMDRQLIPIGKNIFAQYKQFGIHRINKYGFLQIETDDGVVTQHLNNFKNVNPEDLDGIWWNDYLGMWTFEDSDGVNSIPESFVYLLLDTHSRSPRYYADDDSGPVYTYDYTKAKAFFSETEALKCAGALNRKLRTTFTADQWI
ncbi:MAG: hypothetical protein NC131_16950 [Roseburia sp.]|nr:hypothetical protein [Roseburia sp.]